MVNLLKLTPTYKSLYYYIVLIGAGGNGGYTVQRLTKMMSAFSEVSSFLMIADPDTVEQKTFYGSHLYLQILDLKIRGSGQAIRWHLWAETGIISRILC